MIVTEVYLFVHTSSDACSFIIAFSKTFTAKASNGDMLIEV